MAMTIDVEHLDGDPPVTVVALDGELDASNYEQVIDVVRDAYAGGAAGLVLDLSSLTFMASSGLFALHSAVRIMRGETPPDPEAGWGAMHQMADRRRRARTSGSPAPRSRSRGSSSGPGMTQLFGMSDARDDAVAALGGG